jgi:hypothetical protein
MSPTRIRSSNEPSYIDTYSQGVVSLVELRIRFRHHLYELHLIGS